MHTLLRVPLLILAWLLEVLYTKKSGFSVGMDQVVHALSTFAKPCIHKDLCLSSMLSVHAGRREGQL
jgi:hypothetical protein